MITTPRLPREDFANYSPLAELFQRQALSRHSTFVPDWTLSPFRDALFDIFNVQNGMFEFAQMPWEHVRKSIKLRCAKYPNSEQLNVGVAEGAWNWAQENMAIGKAHDAEAVPLGGGWFLNYWHGFYVVIDGEVLLPFFDARKGASRVSLEGAKLICSINSHYIARGRFRHATPVVVQFPERRGQRKAKVIRFDKSELMRRDSFEPMLLRTAEMWREIVQSRGPGVAREDPRQSGFGF
ncbi:type VI toxin-antitoxin system SocB family DNA replication inhibitor toxin [Hyphomonas johnsonii]|uniref:Uncharacterized protein n=1 Tax=Hyphomonas johnsonii MHS-2 TaxID=1280950 RepID=A0A059FE09_9PROT|nr:hypothetical protein [Hyphomonas johnsonii]KCZ88875.1 hypothetical protein HJO_15199 [Hyphomonas johnsonii MHS-2]